MPLISGMITKREKEKKEQHEKKERFVGHFFQKENLCQERNVREVFLFSPPLYIFYHICTMLYMIRKEIIWQEY
jgi:hypothetical protein